MDLLESKYLKNQHNYQGDALVESVTRWLDIVRSYANQSDHEALEPIIQELDNLEEIINVIVTYHENPRRPS